MKKCKKCNIEKSLSEYHKSDRYKTSGLMARCKDCMNTQAKNYRVKNSDQWKAARKKYYEENREVILIQKQKYFSTDEAKNKKSEYDKIYRDSNKKQIASYKKEWESKRKNDIDFKIKRNLRRRINHFISGDNKSASTMELLGCKLEFFKTYIANKFYSNMSWENYGKIWHIDHIKPCSAFNLLLPEQQKLCFHYTNMQPLLVEDNLKKGSKYRENI